MQQKQIMQEQKLSKLKQKNTQNANLNKHTIPIIAHNCCKQHSTDQF